MDSARFAAILDAYGSDPRRWPEEERDAARRFARDDAPGAVRWKEAARLDDLLFAHRVPAPSALLRAAVLARAPSGGTAFRRIRLWWAALGLGIAAAGGALAGSAATAALVAPEAAEHLPFDGPGDATAFGDIVADEGAADA